MKDILVLYSGGLDSTTALYEFSGRIKRAISFNYGSKHNQLELQYAQKNCNALNIEHQIINLDLNALGFVSSLLESGDKIPDGTYGNANMKKTVVPFRNGIMLSIAAGIAESIACKKILLSNHSGDHDIYPDCRPSFIDAISSAITLGTYDEIKVFAPYTHLTKREIALKGKSINISYEDTYSCYNGGTVHCGTCGTCIERKEALEGFDKTRYLK